MGSIQILTGLLFSPSCGEGASSLRFGAKEQKWAEALGIPPAQKANALVLPWKESGFVTPNSTTTLQKDFMRKAMILWPKLKHQLSSPVEETALETADSPPASASSLGEEMPREATRTSPCLAPWTREAQRQRKRSRILTASINQIA